jgi:signal transduction histidine kinase
MLWNLKFLMMPGHNMLKRFNWRMAAVVALIAAYIALVACSFYFLYTAPTVGVTLSWSNEDKHYQVTTAESWSQLKPGDVIIGIGGLNAGFESLLKDNIYIENRAQLFSWLHAKKEIYSALNKPSVPFQVIRNGIATVVYVAPRQAGTSFLANLVFLHFITGTIFFLIGVIVFYKAGTGRTTFLFLVMCIAMTLIFITNSTSLMSEIVYNPAYLSLMNLMNIVCAPLGIILLLHFCQLVPRRRRFLERYSWLVPLYYVICLAVIASFQIPALNALIALPALGTVVSIAYGYFHYREPIERQQMKWVLAGFIFGFGPWILINAIPMLITGQRLMDDTILGFFLVLIPLTMAFAIWKYRLMDIDAYLEGTFAYAITLIFLGVLDFAVLGLLGDRLTRASPFNGIFISLILTASLYIILRDRIRLLIRTVFKRTDMNQTEVIALLNKRTLGCSPDGVLKALHEVVRESFQPRKAVFFIKETQDDWHKRHLFDGYSGIINLWESPGFSGLVAEEFYVAVVLALKAETVFVLLLGRRQNSRFYSGKDLATLDALLIQCSALYESAILFEENLKESEARLREEKRHMHEKETMLKDLHDGIGGIAVNINLIAENALASSSPDDTRKALSTISSLSKEGLFEVSAFLQSLDSSEANFESLIAELRHLGATIVEPHGMLFLLKSSDLPYNKELGSPFFLNVLRVYKEALTNIVKHSKAQTVKVQVGFTDGIFTLSIQDDGVGFIEGGRKGRGLQNMKTRMKSIGGRLSVSSEAGVKIYVEVPWIAQEGVMR